MAAILSGPQCVTLSRGDALLNWVIIGSGNDLLPVSRQASTWTNDDLILPLPLERTSVNLEWEYSDEPLSEPMMVNLDVAIY